MAKIYNGLIEFASVIKPTGNQPLDDRVVVQSFSDLCADETFGIAKYNGMLVAVIEDEQVYMLRDSANSHLEDSWVPVGSGNGAITAENYTAAVALATSENVGQLIYVTNSETATTENGTVEYLSGPYVVSGASSIVKLGTMAADGKDYQSQIDAISANVATVSGDVTTLKTTVGDAESGLVKGLADLKTEVEAIEVPVKDVKVGEESVLGEDGVAIIDLSDYATQTDVNDAVSGKLDTTTYETYTGATATTIEGLNADIIAVSGATESLDDKIDGEITARENAISGVTGRLDILEAIDHVDDVVYEGQHIYLVSNGKKIGEGFDASDFVKDGLLDTVLYDADTNKLTLSFKVGVDGQKDAITVDLNDLVDVYKAGEGLTATTADDGTTFAIDWTKVAKSSDLTALAERVTTAESGITSVEGIVATKAAQSDLTALAERVTTAEGKVTTLEELVGNKASEGVEASGLFKEIATVDSALTTLAGRVTANEEAIATKLSKLAKVNGVEFNEDSEITLDSSHIKLNAAFGKKEQDGVETDRYTTDNTIQYALVDIDTRIDAINTTIENVTGGGVIADITAGDGVNVDKSTKTNPAISVNTDGKSVTIDSNKKIAAKISSTSNNALSVDDNGLYVKQILIEGDDVEVALS